MNVVTGFRKLFAPRPLDVAGLNGYHRLARKIELVKFSGGAEGRTDNFGLGEKLAGGLTLNGGRTSNEDGLLLALCLKMMQKRLLITVADGMGGYGNGEVASAQALNVFAEHFCLKPKSFTFAGALDRAADRLAAWKAGDPRVDGRAGTTLVSGLIDLSSGRLRLAHIGDARAYLFRNGGLMMLTKDDNNMSGFLPAALAEGYADTSIRSFRHSLHCHDLATAYDNLRPRFSPELSEILYQLGIDYFNAPSPPFCDTNGMPLFNSMISKALGVGGCRGVHASDLNMNLEKGDILLLSSDGLHDYCTYHALAAALAAHRHDSPLGISEAVYGILQNMGDNVTIAVYRHG